jgi:hypothetical protein
MARKSAQMFHIRFFPENFICVAYAGAQAPALRDIIEGAAVCVTGKLMDPEFVRSITGRYIPFTAAVAKGFARGARGRGKNRILLLLRKRGGTVLGTLLLNLSPADLEKLDAFEQVPEVRVRSRISVAIGARERTVYTYLHRTDRLSGVDSSS